ncbi:protein serine/threonine phosphatase 2C family protein, partial [Candidatus Dependentiae bacterium]|nr:protein serine/threonine phosphatase 2C family protein [Candidatus Dependentiae bacterium]
VYDGHGGANAAKYTTKNLYNNFLAEKGTIPNRLIQAFEKTDQQIQNSMNDGTTAVAAFINGDKAYIANAGDARALIIRNGKIITATKDHKPNDPVEKARIEREDGLVWRGRVGGRLAVARALGDKGIIGVSATPDIYEQTLQNGDIIVLACDGLWDVMTNKQVAQLVHTAVQKQRAETLSAPGRWESVTDDGNADLMGAISRMLRDRAYDAGSRDNISVMVIQIKL